ncbi:hypothetical protein ACIGXF_09630 [Streptomyces sp. NPDC053086]|uniref:hypothetical protein n=1 Tax=unclassified Streptomyces TaxID=2593676 RepID=UPI0037D39F64
MSASDGTCAGTGWSAVESAPANSQLAGVLAGFVFAGIVMIITERRVSVTRITALRVLISAFIALALDSYAFSLLNGDVAENACVRIWTESLIASGILAVGAVAVMAGISWLLNAYIENQSDEAAVEPASDQLIAGLATLERVLRRIVYGVTLMTVLLLSTVANDYVNVVFAGRSKPWWGPSISPLYVLLASLGMMGITWWRQRKAEEQNPTDGPSQNALSTAFAAVTSYALGGTAAIGSLTSTPISFWNPAPNLLVITTISFVLIVPVPAMLALIYAMPSPRVPAVTNDPANQHGDDPPDTDGSSDPA